MRADVALVGTGVDRDAGRAGLERDRRGADQVWNVEGAAVAQQGHLVDVDRQRGAAMARVETAGDERIHRRDDMERMCVRTAARCGKGGISAPGSALRSSPVASAEPMNP